MLQGQKKGEDNEEKKHPIRCSEGPGSGQFEIYETAKETLMYRTVFWTLWERERVG